MTANIRQPGIAAGPLSCADTPPDGRAPRRQLMELLDYIFTDILPRHGYALREDQQALAGDIFEAAADCKVLLAEAGVGIGKTHAYLIAMALIRRGRVNNFWLESKYPGISPGTDMPMVITTSSIALQKAIAEDYIPELSRILMQWGILREPLSCVIRKGKDHYVCDRRLHNFLRQDATPIQRDSLAVLATGNAIDLDDQDGLSPYIKRRVCVSGPCGRRCGYRKSCRYQRLLQNVQSNRHDFQITNHNYFLADTLRRARGQPSLLPDYQAIVIDEGHKFMDAARQMYGLELSSGTLPGLVRSIRTLVFQPGESTATLHRDANKLEGQAKRLFQVLEGNVPDDAKDTDRLKTVIDDHADRYLHNLVGIMGRLASGLEERRVLPRYRGLRSRILRDLADIRGQITTLQNHTQLIYWLEQVEGESVLRAFPKHLGELLHRDLWDSGVPIVLTSGTLSAGGDFTRTEQSLGLDMLPRVRLLETARPSPFKYQDNVLLYISENVQYPDNESKSYIRSVSDELEQLIRAAHGHTVVLFTSYRAMEAVARRLRAAGLPFPIFTLARQDGKTLEQFRASGNGVLLATGSMWEGIDLPGDILSLLVVVRLPFPVPDAVSEYERFRYPDLESYKRTVITPDMLIKLVQGFGRLIRTMTDNGIFALLDSRVRIGSHYREPVLAALPHCRVISSIFEIPPFLQEKKPMEYFRY